MITFFGCVPVTMKPPIRALSPVSTRKRVEILPSAVFGVAVGDAVGFAVGVAVGFAVAVAVAVALGVAVAVAVAVAVGVAVAVAVAVGVGVGVGKLLPNSNAPISLTPTRGKPR